MAASTITSAMPASSTKLTGSGLFRLAAMRSTNTAMASMPGAMPSSVPKAKSRKRMCEAPATILTTEKGATGTKRITAIASTPRSARRRLRRLMRAPASRNIGWERSAMLGRAGCSINSTHWRSGLTLAVGRGSASTMATITSGGVR